MRRVIVTIDRLTLKGVRYEDRHAVAQGLQEQLTALFAEPGMAERLSTLGNKSRLRVANLRMATDMTAQQLGATTGRAIAAVWSSDKHEMKAGRPNLPDRTSRSAE